MVRPARLLWIARVLAYRRRWGDAFHLEDFGLNVGPRVSLMIDGGSIRAGRRLQLREGCEVWALGGDIVIGDNVFFNRFCAVIARGGITIGSNCLFGSNVGIYDHEHAFEDGSRLIYQQDHRVAPVTIGSDVWVGSNAMVTAGVSIGDRVVVGANSVVTTDLESGGMYAGVPARFVRRL